MALRTKTRDREDLLNRRHKRVRRKVAGSTERPRLSIHRSNKNMQGQITDDSTGRVLVGVTTGTKELDTLRSGDEGTKSALAKAAGKLLAEKAIAAGITKVVFDRGGYLYHGRVAAFAEGAREGGLEF
jgi:large subunit ribosomal protein L18